MRFDLLALCLFLLPLASATRADTPKPNDGLRQELLKMTKEDQDARKEFLEWMKKQNCTDADTLKKSDAPAAKKMAEIDRKNTARMKEIVDKHGWPGKTLVGADGANAAWLLVQHADRDREFQKMCLGLMKELLPKGEVVGQDVAHLTDRVLVGEGKKQVYGTQCDVVKGEVRFKPIEDETNVDKRRAEVGLQPLAEYKKLVEELYKTKKE